VRKSLSAKKLRKSLSAKKLLTIAAFSSRSGEDNWSNDLTRSKSLRQVIRRLIFGTKKNDFYCGERAKCTLLLSRPTWSTRNEKLSGSSNVKDPAAGGNESRIFRTAPDSCHFGNESTTVTFFWIIMQSLKEVQIRAKIYVLPLLKNMFLFMKKYMNRMILMEKWLRINIFTKNRIHAFYCNLLYVRVQIILGYQLSRQIEIDNREIFKNINQIFDTYQFFIVLYIVTFKNIYKKYLNVSYPTDIEVPIRLVSNFLSTRTFLITLTT